MNLSYRKALAGIALWPVAGAAPNARQWLVAAPAIRSLRLGQSRASAFLALPPPKGVVT